MQEIVHTNQKLLEHESMATIQTKPHDNSMETHQKVNQVVHLVLIEVQYLELVKEDLNILDLNLILQLIRTHHHILMICDDIHLL